uniref:Uncharacterized protein n=1 Tax=Siphoviridae sp. ct2kB26 TaxID=2825317 RepID=A0A8S5PAH8_9CAUD|nr:MAG TPA: hypothetical protein [Siphoviridae sp. ct2kB26]
MATSNSSSVRPAQPMRSWRALRSSTMTNWWIWVSSPRPRRRSSL